MQNPQENAFARNIFNKVAPTSLKEALAQVLSPELCEMFKHTFFIEYFWTTASVFS